MFYWMNRLSAVAYKSFVRSALLDSVRMAWNRSVLFRTGSSVFTEVRNDTLGVTLEFLLVPFLTNWPYFIIEKDYELCWVYLSDPFFEARLLVLL